MNADQFPGDAVKEEGRLSLIDLRDDLLILILNRVLDLKSLFLCSLVSPRFSSLIPHHVHSVHFAVPRHIATDRFPVLHFLTTDTSSNTILRFYLNGLTADISLKLSPVSSIISFFYGDSFFSAVDYLRKFESLRSLHLVLPYSTYWYVPVDDSVFKWTAKCGATIDTFVFLSVSIIRVGRESDYDEQEQEQEQDQEKEREREDLQWKNELLKPRIQLGFQCLRDLTVRRQMLHDFIREHPLLEYITITDSENQGSLSLRDSQVVETRNRINSSSLEAKSELERVQVPVSGQWGHVPMLKLPVSRKVMVSATLVVMEMVDRPHQVRDWGDYAAGIATLFSEQGDEEFAEAIVEMMVTHKNRMKRLL